MSHRSSQFDSTRYSPFLSLSFSRQCFFFPLCPLQGPRAFSLVRQTSSIDFRYPPVVSVSHATVSGKKLMAVDRRARPSPRCGVAAWAGGLLLLFLTIVAIDLVVPPQFLRLPPKSADESIPTQHEIPTAHHEPPSSTPASVATPAPATVSVTVTRDASVIPVTATPTGTTTVTATMSPIPPTVVVPTATFTSAADMDNLPWHDELDEATVVAILLRRFALAYGGDVKRRPASCPTHIANATAAADVVRRAPVDGSSLTPPTTADAAKSAAIATPPPPPPTYRRAADHPFPQRSKCNATFVSTCRQKWQRTWAACPQVDLILRALIAALPATQAAGHTWRFIDVGANKGYTVAEVLSLFSFVKPTPAYLGTMLASLMPGDWTSRGACCDQHAPLSTPPLSNTTRLEIFIFEPAPSNYQFMAKRLFPGSVEMNAAVVAAVGRDAMLRTHARTHNVTVEALRATAQPYVELYHSAALAPRAAPFVRFPDVPLGSEVGGVGAARHDCDVFVPTSTLDAMLGGPEAPPFFDLVLIDTEGFDLEVILGARSLLDEGRIGAVVFELHRRTETRLPAILEDFMSPNGYECFHLVNDDWEGILVPISGPCWQRAFDIRGWYNSVCFNVRIEHVRKAVESLLACRRAVPNPRHCDFAPLPVPSDASNVSNECFGVDLASLPSNITISGPPVT